MIKLEFDAAYCKVTGLTYTSDAYKRIKTQLSYTDQKIEYNNKMSKYGNYKDPTIYLYMKDKFYTGLLARVLWILNNCNEPFEVVKNVANVYSSRSIELPDWMYQHQKDMIAKTLDIKRGVVQSPTGSGKSIAMAWLVKHFPTQNVLITVPEKSLLTQMKQTLATTLDVPVKEIGEVSGNKKEFNRVTIGIINSLSNIANSHTDPLKKKLINTEVLICDEAHRVGANFYRDICEVCVNTDYRLGFSATAWREGGDNLVMEGLLGPLIYQINAQELVDLNILTKPIYVEVPFRSPNRKYSQFNAKSHSYNTKNGKPDRNEVYTACIVRNSDRNNLILNTAITYIESGAEFPAMILVERIEHGEILRDLLALRGYNDVPYVYGNSSLKERRAVVDDLKNNNLKLVIASSVFNEGQDIPNLGLGIIAGGGGSESRIIQQVGRFIRKSEGKSKGIVIDIADDEQYYLQYNFYTRREQIKKTYPNAHIRIEPLKLIEQAKNGFKYI